MWISWDVAWLSIAIVTWLRLWRQCMSFPLVSFYSQTWLASKLIAIWIAVSTVARYSTFQLRRGLGCPLGHLNVVQLQPSHKNTCDLFCMRRIHASVRELVTHNNLSKLSLASACYTSVYTSCLACVGLWNKCAKDGKDGVSPCGLRACTCVQAI